MKDNTAQGHHSDDVFRFSTDLVDGREVKVAADLCGMNPAAFLRSLMIEGWLAWRAEHAARLPDMLHTGFWRFHIEPGVPRSREEMKTLFGEDSNDAGS